MSPLLELAHFGATVTLGAIAAALLLGVRQDLATQPHGGLITAVGGIAAAGAVLLVLLWQR